MPTIKIDNIDYDTEKLSDEAKAQLVSLQFCYQNWPACKLNLLRCKQPVLHTLKPCNQHFLPCLQETRLNSTDARSRLPP